MTKAFQHDADGYFVGEIDDYGLLPNNATYTAPKEQDGHIPCWVGAKWEQVENHKGKEGYLDGKQHTIKDYGPLPKGWSNTPPPPTKKELTAQRLAVIDTRLASLDVMSVRPLRAVADGSAAKADTERLASIEKEAKELRVERKALEAVAAPETSRA